MSKDKVRYLFTKAILIIKKQLKLHKFINRTQVNQHKTWFKFTATTMLF
jgi:hypothetical protein